MADYEILDLLGVSTEHPTAEPSKATDPKKPAKEEAEPQKKKTTRKKDTKPAYTTDFVLPQKRETRNRRVQLLMTPSLYDRVKEVAVEYDTNVNDLINIILENVLRK